MKALWSFETSGTASPTTSYNISEDLKLNCSWFTLHSTGRIFSAVYYKWEFFFLLFRVCKVHSAGEKSAQGQHSSGRTQSRIAFDWLRWQRSTWHWENYRSGPMVGVWVNLAWVVNCQTVLRQHWDRSRTCLFVCLLYQWDLWQRIHKNNRSRLFMYVTVHNVASYSAF